MRGVVIHCNPVVPWQLKRGQYFAEGFRRIGVPVQVCGQRNRLDGGIPILLGTTFWRGIEQDGGDYILVDRCSFGDTEKFVSLVWNGHGRRGNHCVPENPSPERWRKIGTQVKEWRQSGDRIVLCGQGETYTEKYGSIVDWYCRVTNATHFRGHPAVPDENPMQLPMAENWAKARLAVTLNSSVGVKSVLAGVPTVTMDEGAMAWDVTSHDPTAPPLHSDRLPWCHWLAYTQHSDDEIRDGSALRQLLNIEQAELL